MYLVRVQYAKWTDFISIISHLEIHLQSQFVIVGPLATTSDGHQYENMQSTK